jgi:choline dehydrogenase
LWVKPNRAGYNPEHGLKLAFFSVIVVGSGSAGNVVASRLSEDKSVSVLLLESGGNNTGDPNVRIAWNLFALQETELDWQFRTTPQKNLKNSHGPGRVSKWPRGKAVGGSSTINAALYVRASPNDYNSWAKYHGCPLWSYEHCLPYFKKAQRFHGFAIPPSSPYVGTSGPLGVTEFSPSMVNPVSNDWMVSCGKALASIGCPLTEDYNGESPYGVGLTQATTEGGKRCDTFTGYLRRPDADTGLPITESRKDRLHVVTKAQVTRVALNDANTKAIGVYVKIGDGPEILVKAKKEVILSAGAIGSPWILQSSGIGDKAWLAEAGIECKVEIPAVGKNLKDHLFVPMVWENVEGDKDALTGEVTPKMMSALFNYNLFQSGPLATAMIESMAFANSGLPEDYPDLPRPDFEYGGC